MNSRTYDDLLRALRRFGDPLVPLRLESFRPSAGAFRLRLKVKVAMDADSALVMPAVEESLRKAFSFEARDFGQSVSVDDLAAIAQAVPGVVATHTAALHRANAPHAGTTRLQPHLPVTRGNSLPEPAELLMLDPSALVLEALP
jgi:hypothetical protein